MERIPVVKTIKINGEDRRVSHYKEVRISRDYAIFAVTATDQQIQIYDTAKENESNRINVQQTNQSNALIISLIPGPPQNVIRSKRIFSDLFDVADIVQQSLKSGNVTFPEIFAQAREVKATINQTYAMEKQRLRRFNNSSNWLMEQLAQSRVCNEFLKATRNVNVLLQFKDLEKVTCALEVIDGDLENLVNQTGERLAELDKETPSHGLILGYFFLEETRQKIQEMLQCLEGPGPL
ncbi:uncharacterized protein RJT20DRAFT_3155 [Scheffersomyces xylosifermentans]|uniref:uncharacterized protein n=1 Tax=Scheffersomyces xylosifermentans TaxID=1304137 RepID=UPI00315DD8E4